MAAAVPPSRAGGIKTNVRGRNVHTQKQEDATVMQGIPHHAREEVPKSPSRDLQRKCSAPIIPPAASLIVYYLHDSLIWRRRNACELAGASMLGA